jgi:hypothetical protein
VNFVRQNGKEVVIRQVPIVLLLVTALFSLPLLAFSLFHLVNGTDVDGKFFCLFAGLFLLWLFLEFVATRERFEIDSERKSLTRSVQGVFRRKRQNIDLSQMKEIGIELKLIRGRRRQYLYIYGSDNKFQLNSPEKVYLNHGKMGNLLSEVTLLPFKGQVEV